MRASPIVRYLDNPQVTFAPCCAMIAQDDVV
jgi:hypothetical protein